MSDHSDTGDLRRSRALRHADSLDEVPAPVLRLMLLEVASETYLGHAITGLESCSNPRTLPYPTPHEARLAAAAAAALRRLDDELSDR